MMNVYTESILYLRISDESQTGLGSQEHRGRVHCKEHGWTVAKVFYDDMTGRGHFSQRKGMVDLLRFLEDNPKTNYVVVFDDIKRFSRDTLSYLMLKEMLNDYGAKMDCLNYKFDDSPEGIYNETCTAAQGQLEAEQGRRQVIQKQTARIEQGFWTFNVGRGYRYVEAEEGGQVLVRDEPIASYIAEALEGFASGRFQTQMEVGRFLGQFPQFPKTGKGMVHADRIKYLLTQPIYAGYIEYAPWGLSLRKGQHEGLISYETFLRIQERLKEGAYAPARKNLNADFPLRGFVECECGSPFTACWSKGRNKYYAYYICQNRECDYYGKSLNRDKIESEFGELVKQLTPPKGLIKTAIKFLKMQWEHRAKNAQGHSQSLEAEKANIDKEINRLMSGVIGATDPDVIGAFESKIKQCKQEKIAMDEKIAQCGQPVKDFDEIYRTALDFLGKPHELWVSELYEYKRALLKLAFTGRVKYVRNEGYRTNKISLPFKVLGNKKGHQNGDLSCMVEAAGN